MKTIKELKTQFGEVKLDILIANRVDTTKSEMDTDKKVIVKEKEYETKLREKIIMAGIHHAIKESEWELKTRSAKKDKRLMVADNICNSFLTRSTKFKGAQSEYINAIYNDSSSTMIFPVLQASLEVKFTELMSVERLGEAVSVICQCDNENVIEKCMQSVKQRLMEMQSSDIELQYRFIKAILEYYLNITHNYRQCEKVN